MGGIWGSLLLAGHQRGEVGCGQARWEPARFWEREQSPINEQPGWAGHHGGSSAAPRGRAGFGSRLLGPRRGPREAVRRRQGRQRGPKFLRRISRGQQSERRALEIDLLPAADESR